MRKITPADHDEFFARIIFSSGAGCWKFDGCSPPWYGYATYKGNPAHRVMWELLNGPVPNGFVVDHLCEEPHCINIHHLEPVTRAENTLRSVYGRNPTPLQLEMIEMKSRHAEEKRVLAEKYGRAAVKKAMSGRPDRYTRVNARRAKFAQGSN